MAVRQAALKVERLRPARTSSRRDLEESQEGLRAACRIADDAVAARDRCQADVRSA